MPARVPDLGVWSTVGVPLLRGRVAERDTGVVHQRQRESKAELGLSVSGFFFLLSRFVPPKRKAPSWARKGDGKLTQLLL